VFVEDMGRKTWGKGMKVEESIWDRSKERVKANSRRNGEKFSTLRTYNLFYLIP